MLLLRVDCVSCDFCLMNEQKVAYIYSMLHTQILNSTECFNCAWLAHSTYFMYIVSTEWFLRYQCQLTCNAMQTVSMHQNLTNSFI
uniref:Uncharacterized protein n=1 Tax=Anguilla anguilla TaxID=7936 RepID=A0A0E9XFK9_ANGAN